MSKKALMVLVVILAALACAMGEAKWKWRAATPSRKSGAAGEMLLSSVELNTVRSITIEDGTSTTHLAQVDGVWCVAEQDNYPVDLNRLREMMRSIDEMGGGQIVAQGSTFLAEYGLAADGESAPLRITLGHEKGTTVLSLGKMREQRNGERSWGPSPGRYARVDEGPVRLLKEDVRMAQAVPDQWWDRSLLEVSPETIQQVVVGDPDGSYAVERGTNGTFTLVNAADGEVVDVAAADRLFGALRSLRAEKILPSDVGGSDTVFTNAISYKAEVEGMTYRIQIGAAQSDAKDGGRSVKIEVSATSSATPEQQEAATLAGKKLNNRTFLIPAYLADSLSLKKEALIPKQEADLNPPPVPGVIPSAEREEGRGEEGKP